MIGFPVIKDGLVVTAALSLCFALGSGCARTPISSESSSSPKPVVSALPISQDESLARGAVVFGAYGANPWQVDVEIAQTASQRALGLMNRKALADDAGMLFIFEQHRRHQFYMKNTYIPLDIIFLSGFKGEVEVVGILKDMRPFDEVPRTVSSPSWSALEVRSPLATEHGIKVGDRVVLNIRAPSSTTGE